MAPWHPDRHLLFDVIGAAAGVIVFAPAMALIAIAILIEDGGPVLFRQPRLGYRRVPFDILKFRSMRDGRITRVGRVLRATGLDEIPQLFNILRGEMSAVGPRPLTAADVDRLGWSGERFDFRWECAPGLTGLAQLLGMGAADAALAWDRVHAERWSPWLDCQLIAWSFVVNAFGKARTRRWIHRYAQRFAAEQFALAVAGRVNDNTPIRVEPPPSDNEPDGPQASAGRSRIEEGS